MYNNYKQNEMKRLKVFYLFAAILLSGVMFSCGETIPGDENGSSSGGNNNLKTGQIEMKVYPDTKNKVAFWSDPQKATIDWGDGTIDELTPNGVGKFFTHEYSNQNLRTIIVNTEKMTLLGVGDATEVKINCQFQELKFGNCTDLKSIGCSECALTVLDVNKCTSLTILWCSYNKLSTSALNSLFNSLPKRKSEDEAIIKCYENPGSETCDETIAEKKGWYVNY